MKNLLVKSILFVFSILPCFSQTKSNTRTQIYKETLDRFVKLMDSYFPQRDSLTYNFEKMYGVTDAFPDSVENHKISVLNFKEIGILIKTQRLSVWRMYPFFLDDGKFIIHLVELSPSESESWMAYGSVNFIYQYDCVEHRFIFEKYM